MSKTDCCVFTIVSKNYLHYAINLMASVASFMPQARRVVALCDKPEGLDLQDLAFEVVSLDDVAIPHLDRMQMHYSILELNTAIKPFVFSHLFATSEHTKVVYFDPDIQLFSTGDPLLEVMQRSQIVLTPHLTDFLDDEMLPSEVSILQSGSYNLGFLALSRSDASARLLGWWQQKLLRQCIVDIPNGLFTDQKWMDLVPGIFSQSEIVRAPGWNVAYWNLKHRHIEETRAGFVVNRQPLFFFHFSGLDLGSDYISKHQNRYKLSDLPPACKRLFDIYNKAVDASGRAKFAKLPYAYAKLPSGIRMPEAGRSLLRQTLDWDRPLPDLRTPAGELEVIALLNATIDRRRPVVTALASHLYHARADLMAAFPDMSGIHRLAYVDWFVANATGQCGIDEIFVAPMRTKDRAQPDPAENTPAAPGEPIAPLGASAGNAGANSASAVFGLAYRLAWSVRFIFRPFVNAQTRHRWRMALLRKAYYAAPPEAAPPQPAGVSGGQSHADIRGINVIGYLNAESGVGESARSMLRALAASDIRHSAVAYHHGNASRQSEQIALQTATGLQYGVNLFHINADQILIARDHLDKEFFARRFRIGYWAWELGEFPDEWLESFSLLHEIWVPSTFCQKAIASKSPVPVVCIPHTVTIPREEAADRAAFGLRDDSVCFLSMADMLSVPERKNPLGAVEAFIKAFAGDSRAEMIVKLSNSDVRADIAATLRRHAANHDNIRILEGYLSREEVFTLLASVDCFVSLHRSEGFGLVIAEAMARARVVIATGWSGNMEFMNPGNSLAVSYTLTALEADCGPYRKGQIWAEPDLDDAAQKMRAVLADPVLRRKIGKRAKADCTELLSDTAIGKLVRRRLDVIYPGK